MVKSAMLFLITALALVSSASHAHTCALRLNPQKVREIVLSQAGAPLSFMGLQGTPLEVSSYLRTWKRELAVKLEIESQDIVGNFRRGLAGLEEDSLSDEMRLLIVRTIAGLKAIVIVELDLVNHRLTYFQPLMPHRAWSSSVSEVNDGDRRTLHVGAFEDALDRSGNSGHVLGWMSVRIPGFNLSK